MTEKDLFDLKLTEKELSKISSLGLAHLGDGVFELLVRARLITEGKTRAGNLHRAAVRLVSAPAQAKRAEKLLPYLTEEETEVFHRGRNAKVNSVPKAASVREYHEATALEALFGYLYLKGDRERVSELFTIAMEEENED